MRFLDGSMTNGSVLPFPFLFLNIFTNGILHIVEYISEIRVPVPVTAISPMVSSSSVSSEPPTQIEIGFFLSRRF